MLLKSLVNYAWPSEACASASPSPSPSPGLLYSGAVLRLSGFSRLGVLGAAGWVAVSMEWGVSLQPLDRQKLFPLHLHRCPCSSGVSPSRRMKRC